MFFDARTITKAVGQTLLDIMGPPLGTSPSRSAIDQVLRRVSALAAIVATVTLLQQMADGTQKLVDGIAGAFSA